MEAAATGDISVCPVLSQAPAGMEEAQVKQALLLEFPVRPQSSKGWHFQPWSLGQDKRKK